MQFLVAYDIAAPERLRRVAHVLEQHALRCQKSVFLHAGPRAAVVQLLEELRPLIHEAHDVVQAWQLGRNESAEGLAIGCVCPAAPAALFAGPDGLEFIADRRRRQRRRSPPSTDGH